MLLLGYWHFGTATNKSFVRWQNTYSERFNLGRGVKQGGILSPYLFNLYVAGLLKVVGVPSRILTCTELKGHWFCLF